MFKQLQQRQRNKQAQQWFLKLRNDASVNDDTFYQFNCWLENPKNENAYNALEQTWAALGALGQTTEGQLLVRHANGQWNGAPVREKITAFMQASLLPKSIAGACMVIVTVIMVTLSTGENTLPVEYVTTTAESQALTLSDGSKVTMTPQTRMKVTLNEHQRLITLLSGHAYFDVAKDKARPFSVTYKDYSVIVIGTVFTVNTKREEFAVTVDEGLVTVKNHNGSHASAQLSKGQGITASQGNFGEVSVGHDNQLALWKRGILVYRETPLEQILEETNTYTNAKIFTGTQKLGETLISLSINIGQIDELPEILEALLPIKAIEAEYGKIMLISD